MEKNNCTKDIPRLHKKIKEIVAERLQNTSKKKLQKLLEGDQALHSIIDDLFRKLCQRVSSDHGIEISQFNKLPREVFLSENCQQAFNCICLIAGITYTSKERFVRSDTVKLSENTKVLSFKNKRWYLCSADGEEIEILRTEADTILRENGRIQFITEEAWADILKGDQSLLRNSEE